MINALKEVESRRRKILEMGGQEKIEKLRKSGKLTARERVECLLDENSFVELQPFVESRNKDFGLDGLPADGVITGYGTVDGRPVCVYAQDFTVLGGSLGEMHGLKIARLLDFALDAGIPVIGLCDSGGARIHEGVDSLKSYGEIFRRNVEASGRIPQINVIMGPCAGGAVYSPALGDFVIMTKNRSCHMFVTGPKVIKAVTGEDVSYSELGGWEVHAARSGNCHLVADNDVKALQLVRKLLSYLPLNSGEYPPVVNTGDDPMRKTPEIYEIVPEDQRKPYDVRMLIKAVVDNGEFFEIQPQFAPNATVGFARIDGKSVGIVANNPWFYAGCLDVDASDKIARFIRFCDAFNIPLITLVDVPGFLPGVEQEYRGVIRHGAKIIYAYSEASVPLITVVVRKAYGGAYIAMGSKHLGADIVYAFPTAEIAVMGPEGAAEIIFRREIESSKNPEEMREKMVEEYRRRFANPTRAAARGYVDDVIDPQYTRIRIASALRVLERKQKRRKHGNIPL
ncbi:acyl-CoA carboxylase subunit beta [Archaeoglobus veneficus]|uniref:Propionyl-CoA carboxylase n=1 Tax=Archaeoglobus veneficus (strain DSM 11195 / SNP6) TaxID=693661 RepID=F2KRX0_ARCVS|nr:carboxyl transferase domain-containing protein [Archaeoglobus veneficus]AEA46811.1 Propionyl-CoA carboxylase [Archaeoglobus veneficus SNP6]